MIKYKFTNGGFINTFNPYNDEIYDKQLFDFDSLLNKQRLLNELRVLQAQIEKTKRNTTEKIINNINTIIKELQLQIKPLNLEQFQKDYNKYYNNSYKKQINTEIEQISKYVEMILNIRCFYVPSDDYKSCIFSKLSSQNRIILYEYLKNTFCLFNYVEFFRRKDINIKSYVILQKYPHDINYYVVHQNKADYSIGSLTNFFYIENNTSLKKIVDIDLNLIKTNDITIRDNKKIYYLNTTKHNLFNGKYCNNLIELINKINKNDNIAENIKNDLLKNIKELFNQLYRVHKINKTFMHDTPVHFGNIIIYLMYVNKINLIYNIIELDNKDIVTNEYLERLFLENKEYIIYSYNYYEFLSIIENAKLDNNLTDEIINSYLSYTQQNIYERFIRKILELVDLLFRIKLQFDLNLVKNILSNYVYKILKDDFVEYFPISKRKILETLTETPALEIANFHTFKLKETREPIQISTKEQDNLFNINLSFQTLYSNIDITYEGNSFKDCGETTLFNLLNYLLTTKYSEETNEIKCTKIINHDKLKIDDKETELYRFYKQFSDYDDLIIEYKKDSEKIKNQFAKLLYSKDTEGRELYNIKNICEIIPTFENILHIINIIFERTELTKFDNIEQFIKYFDSNHIVEYIENTETSQMSNIKIDNIAVIVLTEVHGSFDIIGNNSEYIPLLYNELYSPLKNIKSFDELDNKSKLLLYSGLRNHEKTLFFLYIDEYSDKYSDIGINKETIFIIIDNTPIDIINEICDDESALYKVIYNKLEDVSIKLIDKGAIFKNYYKEPIIISVIRSGLVNVLDKIIDKVNINEKDRLGSTALYEAIILYTPNDIQSYNTIIKLIKNGAYIDVTDKHGKTPLIYAIFTKKYDIAMKLIEKKANINIFDKNGRNALMYAINTKQNIKMYGNSQFTATIAEENNLDKIIEILKKVI